MLNIECGAGTQCVSDWLMDCVSLIYGRIRSWFNVPGIGLDDSILVRRSVFDVKKKILKLSLIITIEFSPEICDGKRYLTVIPQYRRPLEQRAQVG